MDGLLTCSEAADCITAKYSSSRAASTKHKYYQEVVGFTNSLSPEFATVVETGIPQGLPFSPILYLCFNADLIEEYVRLLKQ